MAFDLTKLGEWFIPGYFSDAGNPGTPNPGTYKITAEELRKGLITIREGGAIDLTSAKGATVAAPAAYEIFQISSDVDLTAGTGTLDASWNITNAAQSFGANDFLMLTPSGALKIGAEITTINNNGPITVTAAGSTRTIGVNAATDSAAGVVQLATPADITNNTANRAIDVVQLKAYVANNAPAPPDASDTVKGIVELATAAETTTGTDSTRAVHPAGLKVELDKKLNKDISTLPDLSTAP